jgi:hypothetical protein
MPSDWDAPAVADAISTQQLETPMGRNESVSTLHCVCSHVVMGRLMCLIVEPVPLITRVTPLPE